MDDNDDNTLMEPMIIGERERASPLDVYVVVALGNDDEERNHGSSPAVVGDEGYAGYRAAVGVVDLPVPPPQPPRSYFGWFYSTLRLLVITLPIVLFIGLRLFLYVLVLLPFFIRFAYYYYVVGRRTVVRYGHDSIRQSLDIFDPSTITTTTNTPIVFFVCGGAWIIGYKMWGAMLARVLTSCNMTVILPDYRNYPWGNVKQAVADVRAALEYTKQHYPGRPIVAVGQSAGSHLLLTLFLREYIRLQSEGTQAGAETDHDDANNGELPLSTSPSLLNNVHGFIALSGPLDLNAMRTTFHKFGLDRNFVERIFGCSARPSSNNHNNNENLAGYDPMLLLDRIGHIATNVDDDDRPPNKLYFPPLHLYHGMADTTVPVAVAQAFVVKWRRQTSLADRLEKVQFYDDYSHTDPILEGPADGDHRFHRDVYDAVQSWTAVVSTTTTTTTPPSSSSWPNDDESSDHAILRPLSYHCLVQLARFFMPF
jgi:hypothetical protein